MKKFLVIILLISALIFFFFLNGKNEKEEGEIFTEEETIQEEEEEVVEEEIACEKSFVDPRDEQEYCIVEIGKRVWMAENLNYDNGCSSVEWRDAHDKGWCGCYENDEENCVGYKKLYQWSVANDVCPEGWHLPTDKEWGNLITSLGSNSGTKLKTSQVAGFKGEDTVGFNILPAGSRVPGGGFQNLETNAYFWSSDESSDTRAWGRHLITNHSGVYRLALEKAFAFSVRCIQDEVEEEK